MNSHSHSLNNHTHSGPSHTHSFSTADHSHTIAAHNHGIVFGIYEEDNSINLHYHVDNGGGFGAASGNFTGDQTDIELVSVISGTGWKAIRFDVDDLCRIVASVEVKVDVTA